ncbi:MAG: VIT1/CCC1 transporter family protein, partial [Patescibacteria group bacterium]
MTERETERKAFAAYLRTAVFGVEDSLVSTVGLLSGIAVAGVPRSAILVTGFVLIFVEAFSMAVGSWLSENAAQEYENRRDVPLRRSFDEGVVMFVSYFIFGFVPLAPYLMLEVSDAFPVSVAVSLVALFALGAASGRISHAGIARNGLRMLLVGGLA